MQNVSFPASVPLAVALPKGKPAAKTGVGFLQQLRGMLTEPSQTAPELQQAEAAIDAVREEPGQDDTEGVAMAGTLAASLTLPVAVSKGSSTELHVAATGAPEAATCSSQARASDTGEAVINSLGLTVPVDNTNPLPEAGMVGTAGQSAIAETALNQTEQTTVAAGAVDTLDASGPASGKVAWRATPIAAVQSGTKTGAPQTASLVSQLLRQSQVARQRTVTRNEQPGETSEAVALRQVAPKMAIASGQETVNLQPDTPTGAASKAGATPMIAPEARFKVINLKTGDPAAEAELLQGDPTDSDNSQKSFPKVIRQGEIAVDRSPVSNLPREAAVTPEWPGIQVELTSEDHELAPVDGFAGQIDTLSTVKPSEITQPNPVRPWPAPQEQVLRAMETGIRHLQTFRTGDRTTVKLQLFPEELGEVRVKLELVGSTVTAQFEATSGATANLLRDGLPALRQALDSQGFTDVSLTASFAGDFGQASEGRDGHTPRQQQWAGYASGQQLIPDVGAAHEGHTSMTNGKLDYRL